MINPARVNMMRVFGENWWEAWRVIATRRFRAWGINTTGVGVVNFTGERVEDFLRLSRLPYAVTLKRFPKTEHAIFLDFPDVFSPEYAENSRTFARRELAPLARDPGMIGYFINNEPEWMFKEDCCIAHELLVREEPLYTRRHLLRWLQGRYAGIEELNRAWGLSLPAWESLLSPLPRQTVLSDRAQRELQEYEQLLMLAFGQIPLDACRQVDPHHLCLGLRHGGFSEKMVAGSAIFDVFSFNCYDRSPAQRLDMARRSGKPVIIGEWHIGGQETGLMRTALLSCETQEDRARACRQYLEEAAACPWCVAAHYFEYNDQSLLGRFDGEHMSHGLIDCANRPYPAMARMLEETSAGLYDVLTGRKAPYTAPSLRWLEPHW